MFDELRQGIKELDFLTEPHTGELRIGCTETMAAGFVSTVIDSLTRQYPHLTFQLVPADTATLVHRELRPRNVELVVTPTMTLARSGT